MKILVACEESQEVCKAFRKRGHEAYSCDIQECSGGHPEWHIMGDVLDVLNPKPFYEETGDEQSGKHDVFEYEGIEFVTMDGEKHFIEGKWDVLLAFPPCTHLAVIGAAWFAKKRADGRQKDGLEFFCKFFEADCDKIVIENPVNIVSGDYALKWFPDVAKKYNLPRKPSQVIHPWQFGDPFEKTSNLWVKGLPLLKPTNIVDKGEFIIHKSGKKKPKWFADAFKLSPEERSKVRSKTFPGIARAMAEQWG